MEERRMFPFELQLFADGADDCQATDNNNVGSDDGNAAAGDAGSAADDGQNDKTFTQAEVDAIVKERLARAQKKGDGKHVVETNDGDNNDDDVTNDIKQVA